MNRRTSGLLLVLLSLCSACSQDDAEPASETPIAGSVITDPNSTIEMVYIPAGSFMMGSTNADDEHPIHGVSLDDFYIGKYVITQKQWEALTGTNPSEFVGEDLPVTNVSWDDAQLFAARLSKRTCCGSCPHGTTTASCLRLPT